MLPPIIWRDVRGARARNHLWGVEIEPSARFGTLAQEVAEWQRKAVVFVPAAAGGALALGLAGWLVAGWFAAALAGLVGLFAGAVLGHNLRSGTRELEYFGRAVDLAAERLAHASLPGWDEQAHLDRLARELSGYDQFRHAVPVETIKLKITLRRPSAESWLARNRPALERAYARRPR